MNKRQKRKKFKRFLLSMLLTGYGKKVTHDELNELLAKLNDVKD